MEIERHLPKDWTEQLKEELEKPYIGDLERFVCAEYASNTCYPPKEAIFRAFELCSFRELRVVILGQDPYHEPNQANGLCFSVSEGVKLPPSLKNIYKELASDLKQDVPTKGDLSKWAQQGVLLLNTTLTVKEHQANSHAKHGWEKFTDSVIAQISKGKDGVVFMLWGSNAISKTPLIDEHRHCILSSAHPSPLSAYRGFFGNHHFSKANAYLEANGKKTINW